MNERIRELYKQALENKFDYGGGVGVKPGEYYSNYKTVLNAEKFAELIVRECVGICNKIYFDNYPDAEEFERSEEGDAIKKHFGVE